LILLDRSKSLQCVLTALTMKFPFHCNWNEMEWDDDCLTWPHIRRADRTSVTSCKFIAFRNSNKVCIGPSVEVEKQCDEQRRAGPGPEAEEVTSAISSMQKNLKKKGGTGGKDGMTGESKEMVNAFSSDSVSSSKFPELGRLRPALGSRNCIAKSR
jgi:hypothetical protein